MVPFCLTVDRYGHDYLKTMCADIGYAVVPDIRVAAEPDHDASSCWRWRRGVPLRVGGVRQRGRPPGDAAVVGAPERDTADGPAVVSVGEVHVLEIAVLKGD
jgi:hypothetical protein